MAPGESICSVLQCNELMCHENFKNDDSLQPVQLYMVDASQVTPISAYAHMYQAEVCKMSGLGTLEEVQDWAFR